jgi:hypothetical protein
MLVLEGHDEMGSQSIDHSVKQQGNDKGSSDKEGEWMRVMRGMRMRMRIQSRASAESQLVYAPQRIDL